MNITLMTNETQASKQEYEFKKSVEVSKIDLHQKSAGQSPPFLASDG